MENKLSVLVIFAVTVTVASAAASESDSFACCPSATLIYAGTCYDPKINTTVPMRLACDPLYGNITLDWAFTIESGQMVIEFGSDQIKVGPKLACYGNKTNDTSLTQFNPSKTIIICQSESQEDPVAIAAYNYCTIVSIVFLVLTVIVHAVFRELRDLFGTSVINFCGSLAIGFALHAYVKMVVPTDLDLCAPYGFLAYFFLMAAFFWTNSISIQVLRDSRRPSTVDYGWRELRWYMLYSWGTPAILTIIMAIVNYHPGKHDKPGIGLNHCWFHPEQQWYYMYSIMLILLLINLAIFVYIQTIIWRVHFSSTPIKALKFKLSMTFKMIVLMGLPWIFAMISAAADGGKIIVMIIDIAVALQGVFIFLILVARKRVVRVLHQRGLLKCCSKRVERWLAVGEDLETVVPAHTEVPMYEEPQSNGRL